MGTGTASCQVRRSNKVSWSPESEAREQKVRKAKGHVLVHSEGKKKSCFLSLERGYVTLNRHAVDVAFGSVSGRPRKNRTHKVRHYRKRRSERPERHLACDRSFGSRAQDSRSGPCLLSKSLRLLQYLVHDPSSGLNDAFAC